MRETTHAAMIPRARRRAVRARAALALATTLGSAGLAGAAGAAALVGAAPPAASAAVERQLAVMGTALRMRIEARDRAAALRASEAALAALAATEARLSTWRDDSELARLNAAPAGESVTLSAATAAELAAAARCGADTAGAFEPAVGGLVDLWDLRGAGRIPGAGELAAALPASRAAAWRIDGTRAARLHPATRLEEGGFGKGAGLDRALEALGGAPGVTAAWLDLGGQTALLGGGPWTVAVAHPDLRQRAVEESATLVTDYLAGKPLRPPRGPARAGERSPGDLHGTEHVFEHAVRRQPFEIRLRLQHEPVAQHRRGGSFHVVRQQVVAAVGRGMGLRHLQQVNRGARTRTERQRRPVAGSTRQGRDVGEHRRFDADGGDVPPRRSQRAGRKRLELHGIQMVGIEPFVIAPQDQLFVCDLRILHSHLDEKAIELRFRQRIGALELDRVLRRERGKRRRQRLRATVDRDLPLLHRLEERRLRPRRHAVDLVHQQQIREHRNAGEEIQRVQSRLRLDRVPDQEGYRRYDDAGREQHFV